MYFWLIIFLIVIAMIVFTVMRGLQFKLLVNEGVPIQATVVKKWKHGQNKCRLKYEYSTPSQGNFSHSPWVTEDEYNRYNSGDSIDVVVLPNKPKISAMASMVNLAKQALEKKTKR
jgi:hypothetical protein